MSITRSESNFYKKNGYLLKDELISNNNMTKFNTETINEQNIIDQVRVNEGAIEDISEKVLKKLENLIEQK